MSAEGRATIASAMELVDAYAGLDHHQAFLELAPEARGRRQRVEEHLQLLVRLVKEHAERPGVEVILCADTRRDDDLCLQVRLAAVPTKGDQVAILPPNSLYSSHRTVRHVEWELGGLPVVQLGASGYRESDGELEALHAVGWRP